MLVRILERQIAAGDGAGRAPSSWRCSARRSSTRSCATSTRPREALEQLIAEIDPRNVEAHAAPARATTSSDEDWPRVVKIAERQLFLTEDPAERVPARDGAGAR